MFKLKIRKKERKKRKAPARADGSASSMSPKIAGSFLAVLLLALSAAGAAMTLMNLDYFRIRAVEAHGAEGLESFKAEDFLKSARNKNIFRVDIDSMAQTIARRYPDAKSVIVRRRLPDTISITVTLRRPIALLGDDKYYPVDRDGLIFPNADASIWKKLPVIAGINLKGSDKAGRICESKALKTAIELITEMEKTRFSSDYNVTTIDVSDPRNISFFLEDGLEVKIGHESFRERLLKLSQALKNQKLILSRIKYMDLRFKDIVIGQR